MIDVAEAKELLLKDPIELGGERVLLCEALGRVLAEDVIAPHDHPLFDQSAVDGYALRFADLGQALECIDEAAAGSPADLEVTEGKCARIFTGGLMPKGADTVVMQEFTERTSPAEASAEAGGDLVKINDPGLKEHGNVRFRGEQIAAGDKALHAGTVIDVAAIGFLASIGIEHVLVAKKPKIGIVISGSEFHELGTELEAGKIFGSNGPMLQASLQREGLSAEYARVKDVHLDLRQSFKQNIEENDITIITGGVSVGDHDLTRPVLEELGCEIVFHRVAQKPGKPILFARKGAKYIFGLPGNPRAVFVGFYEYVLPIIHTLLGRSEVFMRSVALPLAHDYSKRGQRAEFLAGKIRSNTVEVLKGQNSHMLMSLIGADGFIYIPKEISAVQAGETVEVHLLP